MNLYIVCVPYHSIVSLDAARTEGYRPWTRLCRTRWSPSPRPTTADTLYVYVHIYVRQVWHVCMYKRVKTYIEISKHYCNTHTSQQPRVVLHPYMDPQSGYRPGWYRPISTHFSTIPARGANTANETRITSIAITSALNRPIPRPISHTHGAAMRNHIIIRLIGYTITNGSACMNRHPREVFEKGEI